MRFLSVFHGNVYRSVYFLQIFGGTHLLIIYRVIWVSDFNKALHTRVNNINFLFQSIYTPYTKCEFDIVAVRLVFTKQICSILNKPLTLAIYRKQVSLENR